jgi:hypothetical protein
MGRAWISLSTSVSGQPAQTFQLEIEIPEGLCLKKHSYHLGLLAEASGSQACRPQVRAKSPRRRRHQRAASPRAANQGAKSPRVASPGAKSPRVASPGAKSPRVASPGAKSPRATNLGAKSPRGRARSPGAKSPRGRARSPRYRNRGTAVQNPPAMEK